MRFFISMIIGLTALLIMFIAGLYIGDMKGKVQGRLECVAQVTAIKDKVNEKTTAFKNTINGLKTVLPKH